MRIVSNSNKPTLGVTSSRAISKNTQTSRREGLRSRVTKTAQETLSKEIKDGRVHTCSRGRKVEQRNTEPEVVYLLPDSDEDESKLESFDTNIFFNEEYWKSS